MEEHFVTYEQALALKELGFDEPCFGAYRSHSHFIGHLDIQYCTTNNLKQYEWLLHTLAPLKQQVFKWFREIHGLYSTIRPFNKGEYSFFTIVSEEEDFTSGSKQMSYEEAESACIDKLIELCLYK